MRKAIALLLATVGLAACGSTPPAALHTSPSPVASATSTPPPSASPVAAIDPATVPKLTGAYGLLYKGLGGGQPGSLYLIKADASIAASVSMTWTYGVTCSGRADSVNSLPPVSASAGHVYFRDGSKIRMIVPPDKAVDVTTVPDSSSVTSFFFVSPDDKRIAVVVVSVSYSTSVTTRLYVEDLFGGGHHADIYSVSASQSKNPTTLWPMGWHNGNLVLAVVPACSPTLAGEGPTEWHVSNATTAARVATIKGSNCVMSTWPSPAGVACAAGTGAATLYDWGGKVVGITGTADVNSGVDAVLSPAGRSIFISTLGHGPGLPTRIVQLGPGPYATVPTHAACAWIDEDHLLSTDAVIQFPAETPGDVPVTAGVTPLPAAALPSAGAPTASWCAGRFPGGL